MQTREKLEHKIGKPLAGLYAMFHTLRRDEPVRIAYDNKTLQTSLFFLGNSSYLPSGFAPSRRTRMDDGLMDVRILETGRRFSRLRILTLARAGPPGAQPALSRTAGARVQLHARSTGRPCSPTTARSDEVDEASFSVRYRALPVFRPLP